VSTGAGLRVLAVDDERPALEDLARLLGGSSEVAEVTVADSSGEALRTLAEHRFDAIFVDVRMPGIDGLELASVLDQFSDPPALVFVSAYEDGAVGAFELELHPLDYLMKPVSRARIAQALERVVASRSDGEIVSVEHQRGGATRLVPRASILYVKSEGDYVRIVSDDGRFLVRGALSQIERKWIPYGFVRVHRSYVVNLRRATEIRPELGGSATIVLADGSEVPVARRQVPELRRRLRR
jgi:DNA-binding LytR/AlgR family response regulator